MKLKEVTHSVIINKSKSLYYYHYFNMNKRVDIPKNLVKIFKKKILNLFLKWKKKINLIRKKQQ